MLTQGLALIDCDNFRWRDRKSKADLEFDTETIIDDATRAFVDVFPATSELDIRLYGGWTDEAGLLSRDASWLHEIVPNLRGRRRGLIIRPTLATTMIQFPALPLWGTVRGRGRNQRQKMVDGIMGCDAICTAIDGLVYVAVVTDDDDLLPAILFAHEMNSTLVAWMRTRTVGSAMNDHALLAHNLRIHNLRT